MNGHFEYGDRIVLYQQSVAVAALSESDDYAVVAHFGLRQCSNCYQILPCAPWSYDTCSCETAVYCNNGLCRQQHWDSHAHVCAAVFEIYQRRFITRSDNQTHACALVASGSENSQPSSLPASRSNHSIKYVCFV